MKQRCWHRGQFTIVEDKVEAKIYFCPKLFSVSEHEVKVAIYTLVYGGHCTGAELNRLLNGEVRIYFNPTYHSKKNRKTSIWKIIELISAESIEIDEDEI